MTGRRFIVAAGALSAVLLVLQAFVAQPLSTGFGLIEGWRLVVLPQMIAAAALWLLVSTGCVWLLTRVRPDAGRNVIARRAAAAFAVVTVLGWLPVTVYARLSVYMQGVYEETFPLRLFGLFVELVTVLSALLLVGLFMMWLFRLVRGD